MKMLKFVLPLSASLVVLGASIAPRIQPPVQPSLSPLSPPHPLSQPILAPGDYERTATIDNRERSYLLHVPTTYRGKALPLFYVFHGSSASASVIRRETSFNTRADSLGFFVVYPEGVDRAWNIGECCYKAFTERVNEAAFTETILKQLRAQAAVDTTRIYATGYSDGGTLSYLLACTLPHRFAAVAGISGTLFKPQPVCNLPSPVSALIIHGTGDHQTPYQGQPGGPPEAPKGKSFMYSAPEVTEFWVRTDKCDTEATKQQHAKVIREHFSCPKDAEVLFYTILDGSHGWPGGGRGWIFSPKPPTDIVATDTVTHFFLRHRSGSTSPSTS